MNRAVYFHAVDGRIRIHIPEAKGSKARAGEIAERLSCARGIINVNANPVTGNVLINYDSRLISQQAVLEKLKAMGWPAERQLASPTPGSAKASAIPWWGAELVKFGLETLLTSLIL